MSRCPAIVALALSCATVPAAPLLAQLPSITPLDALGAPLDLDESRSITMDLTSSTPKIALGISGGEFDSWVQVIPSVKLLGTADIEGVDENASLRAELTGLFPFLQAPEDAIAPFAWDPTPASIDSELSLLYADYARTIPTQAGFEVRVHPVQFHAAFTQLRADCREFGWPRAFPPGNSTPTYWTVLNNYWWYDQAPFSPLSSIWLPTHRGTVAGAPGGPAELLDVRTIVMQTIALQAGSTGAATAALNRLRDIYRVGIRLSLQALAARPTAAPGPEPAGGYSVGNTPLLPGQAGNVQIELSTIVLIWAPPSPGDPAPDYTFTPKVLTPAFPGQVAAISYPLGFPDSLSLYVPTTDGVQALAVSRAAFYEPWLLFELPQKAVDGTMQLQIDWDPSAADLPELLPFEIDVN